MKLLIKKSVYESLRKPKVCYIPLVYENEEISKAWNSALHPKDDKGRFTEKGVMELSEEDKQGLIDYLEKESFTKYDGVNILKEKIPAIKQGRYLDEVDACKKIAKFGFDVYLLDECYVKDRKADTFYKKGTDRDFMEIKHVGNHKLILRYNQSVEQAPSTFISIIEDIPYSRYKKLRELIENDNRNGYVIIEYKGKCKIIKKKQL